MADVTSSESKITDYKLGQDNIQIMGLDIHNPVFLISSVTIVAFVIFTLMFQTGIRAQRAVAQCLTNWRANPVSRLCRRLSPLFPDIKRSRRVAGQVSVMRLCP